MAEHESYYGRWIALCEAYGLPEDTSTEALIAWMDRKGEQLERAQETIRQQETIIDGYRRNARS